MLARGFTRRCAWCGDRKAYFVGWFRRQERCHACGHAYRRGDEAFELGAITANIILTFLGIMITILVLLTGCQAMEKPGQVERLTPHMHYMEIVCDDVDACRSAASAN